MGDVRYNHLSEDYSLLKVSLLLTTSMALSVQVNNHDLTLLIIPLILLLGTPASTSRANRVRNHLMTLVILGHVLLLIEESYILLILMVLAFTQLRILLFRHYRA